MKKTRNPEKNILSNTSLHPRNRILYFLLIVIVVSFGLLSRKMASQLPDAVNTYLGDSLWALMIFLVTGFIFIQSPIARVGLIAVSFCYLIEISQLYHANWIDNIRHTTLGGLILGFGFLWTDILAYSIGVGFGVILEKLLLEHSDF